MFFEFLIAAMAKQTSTKAPQLTASRLHELHAIVKDAFDEMSELRIPSTLIHNDFTPGNILIDGEKCKFIDWAEAGWGNPFYTYQHLRALIAKSDGHVDRLSMTDQAYKHCWGAALTEEQINRAIRLAPMLALVSHLYGRGGWLASQGLLDPNRERYARGIARHMDKAALALEGVLCH
ncbi:hypothetical protein GCM10011585_32920 [Edaphobacter dinghuensis]|uniref:Aminoglycoside phosphotransferase domain-containing protein n=2 Tax=Edaphobacter dinghuensis TaxID=1560005 RepID=A0A917HPK7_9BACT|nr:hypothetical protein GCM10011585_32920 [Edaphobacter dinghuensis]